MFSNLQFLFLIWILQIGRYTIAAVSSCADMEPFTCPDGYSRQDLNISNHAFYDLQILGDTFHQNPTDALYPRGSEIGMKKRYVYLIRSQKQTPKNVQVLCLSAEVERSKNIIAMFKEYRGQPMGKKTWRDQQKLPGIMEFTLVNFTLPEGGVPNAEKIKLKKRGDGSFALRNVHMIACHKDLP